MWFKKFLGILFDSKLSFIPHIKYVKKKCITALNLLKTVSRMDWGADQQVCQKRITTLTFWTR